MGQPQSCPCTNTYTWRTIESLFLTYAILCLAFRKNVFTSTSQNIINYPTVYKNSVVLSLIKMRLKIVSQMTVLRDDHRQSPHMSVIKQFRQMTSKPVRKTKSHGDLFSRPTLAKFAVRLSRSEISDHDEKEIKSNRPREHCTHTEHSQPSQHNAPPSGFLSE